MRTLKQKWTEALPVFFSVLCLIGIIYLLIWGMMKFADFISLPEEQDTRTIQEVKEYEYKKCIKYSNSSTVEKCNNYIK